MGWRGFLFGLVIMFSSVLVLLLALLVPSFSFSTTEELQFAEDGQKVSFKIVNRLDVMITIFWDKYKSGEDAIGLVRMNDLQPGESKWIDTSFRHIFEIQESKELRTVHLFQLGATDQTFEITGVRQCCLFEDLGNDDQLSSLFPPVCSSSVWADMKYFLKVAIPEYRGRQALTPSRHTQKGRNNFNKHRHYLNENQPKKTPIFGEHTGTGYKLMEIPPAVWHPIRDFWNQNCHTAKLEQWDPTNPHVNHWESPTYMLWLPQAVQSKMKKVIRPMLEEWIGGRELEYTSLYGIRIYKNTSILLNHVDRSATHAVSCIINVAQRVEEDWLLEVHAHDGTVEHVKMSPGQMVYYESASVIHGRQTPLNGDFYANVFLHFRPKHGWDVGTL